VRLGHCNRLIEVEPPGFELRVQLEKGGLVAVPAGEELGVERGGARTGVGVQSGPVNMSENAVSNR
jgi:hypothetical protein